MSYLQIVVLLLTVFYSNQVLGEQNSATDEKAKLEEYLNKAYAICDVIWSEERGNRHPLSQEIRAAVNNPTSVNICQRIKQSACARNFNPVSNHL